MWFNISLHYKKKQTYPFFCPPCIPCWKAAPSHWSPLWPAFPTVVLFCSCPSLSILRWDIKKQIVCRHWSTIQFFLALLHIWQRKSASQNLLDVCVYVDLKLWDFLFQIQESLLSLSLFFISDDLMTLKILKYVRIILTVYYEYKHSFFIFYCT